MYTWPGMIKISADHARNCFKTDNVHAIYMLDDNNTESLITDPSEIRDDLEYGLELTPLELQNIMLLFIAEYEYQFLLHLCYNTTNKNSDVKKIVSSFDTIVDAMRFIKNIDISNDSIYSMELHIQPITIDQQRLNTSISILKLQKGEYEVHPIFKEIVERYLN